MSDAYDVLVVGGGYAGVAAANKLARKARVALVDPKPDFVHRIRLHELAAGGNPRVTVPFARMLNRRVTHVQARAESIEPQRVLLATGESLRAQHVLVTSGSDGFKPDSVYSLAATLEVRERVAAAPAGSAVRVTGNGLTGIELATEIAYRRPDLRVFLRGRAAVGADLPDAARAYLVSALEQLGVGLGAAADAVTGAWELDATGFVYAQNRIQVARTLAAGDGLWVAGDAAQVAEMPYLRPSCAAAIPMGRHAASNILRALNGIEPEPFEFGYTYRFMSLGRRLGLSVKVSAFDVPTGRIGRGRFAALTKATVCSAVLLAVRHSR